MKLSPEILEKIKKNEFETFEVQKGQINGINCYLVNPSRDNSTKWTKENIIFRSSVWNEAGELISAGYKKFKNALEDPENFPMPNNLDGCTAIDKIDGSLLVCDWINDKLSVRTRGSLSFHDDFKDEINEIIPSIEAFMSLASDADDGTSYLLEFASPANKVVINYGEKAEFWLTGMVDKTDYSIYTQETLDRIARIAEVKRPETYKFSDIKSMSEEIKSWIGKEGVCLYSPCGQYIWKFKAADYLKKHAYKSEINLKNVYNLIQAVGAKDEYGTLNHIEREYDWECAQESAVFVEQVFAAKEEAYRIFWQAGLDMHGMHVIPRKEVAQIITSKYKANSWVYFLVLDSRFSADAMIKLEKQLLSL